MGKKILLFEDNKLIKTAYKDTLERAGFEVMVKNNGEDCLLAIDKFSPDLILLDIMMPDRDGYGVLRDFFEHKIANHIPVLVLTNLSEIYHRDKIMKMGASAYYEKVNMTAPELIQIIKKYLS